MARDSWDWYKHFPSRFIGGVTGLGPDVIGAYIIILDLIYLDGESCPNDPRFLAGILGCNGRKAAGLVQALVTRGKLTILGNRLINETARQVIDDRLTMQRRARDTGATGGRRSADARSTNKQNNGLVQPTLKELEKRREEKRRVSSSVEPNRSQPSLLAGASDDRVSKKIRSEDFEAFYAAFPRHIDRGSAERAYTTARKLASAGQILAGALRYAASRAGEEGKYTKYPATWLNAKAWLDEAPGAGGAQTPNKDVADTKLWLWRLEAFHHGNDEDGVAVGYWQTKWGPAPGHPGCLTPVEAIEAYRRARPPAVAVGGIP